RAGLKLIALRRAVLRRSTLHHVGDVHIFAAYPHSSDHVVEQLPGAADEGFALLIFIGAWSLADKHDFRSRIPYAENYVLASAAQAAASAIADVFADGAQRGDCIAYRRVCLKEVQICPVRILGLIRQSNQLF